jgi:hypothetical protein
MVADSSLGLGSVPDVSKDVPEDRDQLREDSTLSPAFLDESGWLLEASGESKQKRLRFYQPLTTNH